MRRKFIPLLAVFALAATACADGEPEATRTPEATTSPTPAGTPLAFEEASTCSADEYSVPYPAEWNTNTGEVIAECRVFHPEQIELEEATEIGFHWGVLMQIEDVPFDVVAEEEDRLEYSEINVEETTLDGRRAAVIEAVGSGEALLPEGARTYQYVVELEAEGVLIGSTYDIGDLDFEQERAVLDRMMDGLELET